MSCYWGCGTPKNRWCYVVMGLFIVAGLVFLSSSIGVAVTCQQDFDDCRDECKLNAKCADFLSDYWQGYQTRDESMPDCLTYGIYNIRRFQDDYTCIGTLGCCEHCQQEDEDCGNVGGGLMIMWVILIAGATIPCCFFCCCAKNPNAGGQMVVINHDAVAISTATGPTGTVVSNTAYPTSSGIDGTSAGVAYPPAQPAYAQPTYPSPAHGQVAVVGQPMYQGTQAVEMGKV